MPAVRIDIRKTIMNLLLKLVWPDRVPVRKALEVDVLGIGFDATCEVLFGAQVVVPQSVSATNLHCNLDNHITAHVGTLTVTVLRKSDGATSNPGSLSVY